MPSPRAIVAMRVKAERRLAEDVQMLAETMDMPVEEVPQLLVPRVPFNDPNYKHVKFLEGVSKLIERFLDHAGVDHESRRQVIEEEEVAEHQKPEINTDVGVPPAAGDPRLTNIGQGLADPTLIPIAGVLPGMVEGDEGDVKKTVSELDANQVRMLREMEQTRLGGPRASVLGVLAERDAELVKEQAELNQVPKEHQKIIDERQKEAEERAAKAAEAAQRAGAPEEDLSDEERAKRKAQGAASAMSSGQHQSTPERPPAAVRQRMSTRGRRR